MYEHLALLDPGLGPYQHNASAACAKLGVAGPLHYPGASPGQRLLRLTNVFAQLGHHEAAQACLAKTSGVPQADVLLAQANLDLHSAGPRVWLQQLNGWLQHHGLAPLELNADASRQTVWEQIQLPTLPKVGGPLVTVCMACYNAEQTVERAVRSILGQTHSNLELLLVNDASIDGTWPILLRLQQQDSRIKLINQPLNQGTYAARNLALQLAQGEWFTTMDADDLALPQRLELQLKTIKRTGSWVNISDWVRMAPTGELVFKSGWGGVYQHQAAVSLMLHRAKALKLVGFWDTVRAGADSEYMARLGRVLGKHKVSRLNVPTILGLHHPASLTNDPFLGIDTVAVGASPARLAYEAAWRAWHQQPTKKDLFVPAHPHPRKFQAPASLLYGPSGSPAQQVLPALPRACAHLRVLFVLPVTGGGGGVHSVVQEVVAMRSMGVTAHVGVRMALVAAYQKRYAHLPGAANAWVVLNDDNLLQVAAQYDVVVGTIWSSMVSVQRVAQALAHVLPAYYVQDYEPLFYERGTPQWQDCAASYGLVSGVLLFAKTDWIAQQVQTHHGVKVHKVLPSLDHGVFKPRPRLVDSRVHVAAMVRPQTPRRGAARTMRTLRRVQAQLGRAVCVHLFGCKPESPLFKALETGFEFKNHGELVPTQVADVLAGCDVFLDLSDYQAFGRTALEAMACGCAVVVPQEGGAHEYAQHGHNALVLDTLDEEACYRAIVQLLSNKEQQHRLARNGLATAARFSVQGAALSELQLFEEKLQLWRQSDRATNEVCA